MPFPGDDQVVILQALVELGKTGYHSNGVGFGLEIKPRTSKGMTLVHVNNIVPGEP